MPVRQFGERDEAEPGTILMWAGNLAEIPDGWALCDGNNGTPNLLDRFVRMAGDPTTDIGNTGGVDSFRLATEQLPAHNHGGTVDSVGDHSHQYYYGGDGGDYDFDGDNPNEDARSSQEWNTSYSGAHQHSFTTDETGGGSSIENRPEHYQIAFIQKL